MQIGGNNMWKEQLLKPITTTDSNVPTKPKRKDCCEEAKNRWKVYVARTAVSGSEMLKFNKKYGHNFNKDNDKDCILMYNSQLAFTKAKKDCISFRAFLEESSTLKKKEILNEWNRCEGR
jgi:hypothetical protein